MEYATGGDLLTYVIRRSKLNELVAKFIFKQLAESVYYIHSQGFCHRDIKLDNILLDIDNHIKVSLSSYICKKLCDFGVSTQFKKGDVLKDLCGTPAYIAPEILKGNGYDGFISDIWSMGGNYYYVNSFNHS